MPKDKAKVVVTSAKTDKKAKKDKLTPVQRMIREINHYRRCSQANPLKKHEMTMMVK